MAANNTPAPMANITTPKASATGVTADKAHIAPTNIINATPIANKAFFSCSNGTPARI